MALIPFLSNTKAWTDGRLPEPWNAGQTSIHDFILANTDGVTGRMADPEAALPDDDRVNEGKVIRFAAGAIEGVFGHHGSPADRHDQAETIHRLLKVALRTPRRSTILAFYTALRSDSALDYIDTLLEKIIGDPSIDRERLVRFATWIARKAPDRGPVKASIAIAGIIGGPETRDLVVALGRHEEFTLYAAVALANASADAEQDIWRLAQAVEGWGRIHAVERLMATTDQTIKAWLVRDGFRTTIMDEYLALPCAETGGLVDELRAPDPDGALIAGAGDIIVALINGGPAEDMRAYADGPEVVELYLQHLQDKEADLHTFLIVDSIHGYLTDPDTDWGNAKGDWRTDRRRRIEDLARRIIGRTDWPNKVAQGLGAADDRDFRQAKRAALQLGLDPWDAVFRRQQADPRSSFWWDLMQTEDVARVRRVVAHAEAALPLGDVATGPGTVLGVGGDYWAHSALDFVVQDLRRFPGEGWRLVDVALRSPVIRNRNMAVNALNAWPRDRWPAEACLALQRAEQAEPEPDVKTRMARLLAGQDANPGPIELD